MYSPKLPKMDRSVPDASPDSWVKRTRTSQTAGSRFALGTHPTTVIPPIAGPPRSALRNKFFLCTNGVRHPPHHMTALSYKQRPQPPFSGRISPRVHAESGSICAPFLFQLSTSTLSRLTFRFSGPTLSPRPCPVLLSIQPCLDHHLLALVLCVGKNMVGLLSLPDELITHILVLGDHLIVVACQQARTLSLVRYE